MDARQEYERWLHSPRVDEQTRRQLAAMAQDQDAVQASFFEYLSFGTAGLRGIMGPGTARMNGYTVRHATQGLADVILAQGQEAAQRGVVIGCDSRHHSAEFAREAAAVLAANGIFVYLFDNLRPTPELSFAVRHLHCIAGVNITASHNPKEYNGYKAYWEDGAQMERELSDQVSAAMEKRDILEDVYTCDWRQAQQEGHIRLIGTEVDEAYCSAVLAEGMEDCIRGSDLGVVYSAFHGAGYRIIPELLKRRGLANLWMEPQQLVPDGDFPTVESPNPEYVQGFHLAIPLAQNKGAQMILGSDPDADRTAALVRKDEGDWVALSGNQIGILLTHYIIARHQAHGTMPKDPVVIKSIVSSRMIDAICRAEGVRCLEVYTGFKHMGQAIRRMEQSGQGDTIFSYEESYGYLKGTYCRDKDAPVTCMLLTEMACFYHHQGKSLWQVLRELYEKYGWYGEETLQITKEGLEGRQRIAQLMEQLREHPPVEIAGKQVTWCRDYQKGIETCSNTGEVKQFSMPPSNVMYFVLEDGSAVVLRPSGTEPKIKCYALVQGKDEKDRQQTTNALMAWAKALLT